MQNLIPQDGSLLTSTTGKWNTEGVKNLSLFLVVMLLAGCAGSARKGTSHVDPFDAIKVDEMVGNNVSPAPLQKVIVCLNARRETRMITAITNVSVSAVTNQAVQAVTNEVVSIATNYLVTTMTNLSPSLGGAGAVAQTPEEAAALAASEAPAVLVATNAGPLLSTNSSTALAKNSTATAGPGQRVANLQEVRTYNHQITTTSNNLSVTMMTNLIVTAETNVTVAYVTNYTVGSLTNVSLTATNISAHDYFLYTELVPPPDFSLHPGESLILRVDGVRYGFTAAQSGTAFVARRGFTSTVYRVPPEVLVAIANAQDVQVRIRGTTSVIERSMTAGSKQNFKTFLVRYFLLEPSETSPESAPVPIQAQTDATALTGSTF